MLCDLPEKYQNCLYRTNQGASSTRASNTLRQKKAIKPVAFNNLTFSAISKKEKKQNKTPSL